ncbi:hypothetical protein CPS_0204 [Colwellia psychrerythraea 34H]|uniref:Uncharacterized protein n=1 Tax=Colwellia psychrerythraea (strain 34H / ATCC BAA-681) TaxID=167879 RepID=Q48AE1_COLP3|nr:hypothetical protein CPS_0204 [Colwellia psychrerythraea 34H]
MVSFNALLDKACFYLVFSGESVQKSIRKYIATFLLLTSV